MHKNRFRYILIAIFSVLFILQLFNYDFAAEFNWISFLNILVPILMIIAMVLSIKHVKKHGEN